jgi:uncharacterized membrane protein
MDDDPQSNQPQRREPQPASPSLGNVVTTGSATFTLQSSATYFVPLPPAAELVVYEKSIPGVGERLLKCYESDVETARINDRRLVISGIIRAQLGQIFAFVIAILAFYWGVQLIREGQGKWAAILIGSVLTSIVIAFLASRGKDDLDKTP